jgi:hypothetical protein
VCPNLWPIQGDEERRRVLRACDLANAGTKAAKMYTVRNDVWASVEVFVTDPEAYKKLLFRLLSTLQFAMDIFAREVAIPPVSTTTPVESAPASSP